MKSLIRGLFREIPQWTRRVFSTPQNMDRLEEMGSVDIQLPRDDSGHFSFPRRGCHFSGATSDWVIWWHKKEKIASKRPNDPSIRAMYSDLREPMDGREIRNALGREHRWNFIEGFLFLFCLAQCQSNGENGHLSTKHANLVVIDIPLVGQHVLGARWTCQIWTFGGWPCRHISWPSGSRVFSPAKREN